MMATAGLFCPNCQVFHPVSRPDSDLPRLCPTCGAALAEAPQIVDQAAWYCSHSGRTLGPYSLTELRLLAAVGDLKPSDLVWQQVAGRPSAVPARDLLGTRSERPRSLTDPAATPPIPSWAADETLRNAQFIRFPETPLPSGARLLAGPPRRGVRPWVAALVVSALVFGLMGLRVILDRAGLGDGTGGLVRPDLASRKPPGEHPGVVPGAMPPKANHPTEGVADAGAPPAGLMASPASTAGSADARQPRPPTLARIHSSAGWATFGQALPAGAAREAVQLGDFPTQTDVKTRWPDGSIRFAIVTARVARPGLFPLTAVAAAADTFTPEAMPEIWAAFAMGADGTDTYTAGATPRVGPDFWLRGPLVCEARQVVPLLNDATKKPHPFLRVVFDLRLYKDGQGRADITVENTLDTRGATAVPYSVWIGGHAKEPYHHPGLTHHYLTRWRKTFPLNLQAAQVQPDFEPAIQARALPRYLATVAPQVNAVTGDTFDLLGPGDLHTDMTAHGGRPEIAPYPDWTARYLAHKDPRQLRSVLVHGDLAGSWPVHLRKAEGTMPSLDEHPQFWLDPRAEPGNRPLGDLGATGPLVPDIAHQPSLAYVPYQLTGDRYYADEMAFWANYVLLRTFQDRQYNLRGGSEGLLNGNETRGVGWGLRNLADAAAYLPDKHPLKAYFVQKVENNLRWLDHVAEQTVTPLGTLWHDNRPESQSQPNKVWIAPWEQNYIAWAIDRAHKHGFKGGLKHRDRIARFQLSLFTGGTQYRREYAAPYVLAIGERDAAGKITLYNTLAELFQKNYPDKDHPPMDFAGFYGVDARLMLVIGIENGWVGAKDAHHFLWPKLALTPFAGGLSDLALRAGWAIAPDSRVARPDGR